MLADSGVDVVEVTVPMLVSEVVRETETEEGVDTTSLVVSVLELKTEEGGDDTGIEVSVSVIEAEMGEVEL